MSIYHRMAVIEDLEDPSTDQIIEYFQLDIIRAKRENNSGNNFKELNSIGRLKKIN